MKNKTDIQKRTILFADDEYWICEKMKHMVDWDKYSLNFLEPARDGEEVLRRLKEEKIDILITDVNMPYLSGDELLHRIRERYPEVISFVISGYDDFEYVRESFLGGAIQYLTKPVNRQELEDAIEKALRILNEREFEQKQKYQITSALEDYEYSRLLKEVKQTEEKLFCDFQYLMLIKIHNLNGFVEQSEKDIKQVIYTIKRDVRQITGDENTVVFNNIYRANEFIVLYQWDKDSLVSAVEKLQKCYSDYQNVYFTFCITEYYGEISMAYNDAVSRLFLRKYEMSNQIVCESQNISIHSYVTLEQKKQIQRYLKAGKRDELIKILFKDKRRKETNQAGWLYIEVWQTVKQLALIMANTESDNYESRRMLDIDNIIETLEQKTESLDVTKVKETLVELIDYLISPRKESQTHTIKNIIKDAAAYIDKHYNEELNLSLISEIYNVDSSYFSKLFSQEMGTTFTIYITEKRMEKARVLMRQRDMSLTDVAFAVGYEDYAYFSRVFKKNTGMSPREYKSLCRKEEN